MSSPTQPKPAQPTITSASIPKPPVEEPVNPRHAPELAEDIIAKPLVLPDFVNMKLKNPTLALRWVNFAVDTGKGYSSLRYDQMRHAGFVPVKPDELVECPASLVVNGNVVKGDLILCKIDKKTLLGAYKYNAQKATKLGERTMVKTRGQQHVQEALKEVGAPNEIARKISVFVPTDSEAAALTGDK